MRNEMLEHEKNVDGDCYHNCPRCKALERTAEELEGKTPDELIEKIYDLENALYSQSKNIPKVYH